MSKVQSLETAIFFSGAFCPKFIYFWFSDRAVPRPLDVEFVCMLYLATADFIRGIGSIDSRQSSGVTPMLAPFCQWSDTRGLRVITSFFLIFIEE